MQKEVPIKHVGKPLHRGGQEDLQDLCHTRGPLRWVWAVYQGVPLLSHQDHQLAQGHVKRLSPQIRNELLQIA